jgi:hypothetical protein
MNAHKPLEAPGYESLAGVLQRAFDQAAHGKGKERHANDLPFTQQPMQNICNMVGSGFAAGQAIKKIQEAQGMRIEQAVHELLGAIVYLSGLIVHIEANRPDAANDNAPPKAETYMERKERLIYSGDCKGTIDQMCDECKLQGRIRCMAVANEEKQKWQAAGGWVAWSGGDCPVTSATDIQVRLRDGGSMFGQAESLRWGHTDVGSMDHRHDIIAYRI